MKIELSASPARASSDPVQTDHAYISPKELAQRWQCSRSQVDRIARKANFRKLCLGEGKNGTVRYFRADVDAFEARRVS